MLKLAIFISMGILVFSLFGCSISVVAKKPYPNIIPPEKNKKGQIVISYLSRIPKNSSGEICSVQANLKDFCIKMIGKAIKQSLLENLGQYFTGNGKIYKATFNLVRFSHSLSSAGGKFIDPMIKLNASWQFVLRDPNGVAIIRVARTTTGPQKIAYSKNASRALKALLGKVIEEIAVMMEKAIWDKK
jgi:hypothetical protein